MNHQKAMFLLEGFEPGELTPREKNGLDRHLAACPGCAAKAKNVAPLSHFFAQAAAYEPPALETAIEAVRQTTLRAIRAERPMTFLAWARSLVRVEMLVPAGAAAMLLLAVWVKMPGRSEGPVDAGVQVARAGHPAQGDAAGFVMLRSGSDVKIQWRDQRSSHRVRQANSPVAVQAAGKHIVRGQVWNEPEANPAPGTVTYYLVD